MAQKKTIEELKRLTKEILDLTEDDYKTVMCTVVKANPHPATAKYINNLLVRSRKEEKGAPKAPNSGTSVKLFVQPEVPKLKEGRDGGQVSRALESRLSASLSPDLHGLSAWKIPILFRGDLVPRGGKLFIDVEKLTMKLGWGKSQKGKIKHRQVANNVAVVDEKGILIFWAFISRNPDKVCQYMSKMHRITRNKVMTGVSIDLVREILSKLLDGNMVVGAKLDDDLASFSYEKEFSDNLLFTTTNKTDLQDFYKDDLGQPYNLKDLAKSLFPEEKREFQGAFHSALSDARMTMKLFLKMEEMKAECGESEIFRLRIDRTKSKFIPDKNDICKCKL